MVYRWLAAALGQLGRTDEAREALHTAMTTDPQVFDRFVRSRVPWHRPEDYEHMLDGLRKAGWQGLRAGNKLTDAEGELRGSVGRVENADIIFDRGLSVGDKELSDNTIRVTTTGLVADRLRTSSLMDTFHVRYPSLRLELIISDRCLDLSTGEADLAIRAGEPEDEGLVRRKIADVGWAVYASRSYISRHGAPECLEDIEHHFVVACNCSEGHAEKWLRSVAPHGTVVARCDAGSDQLRAVKSGAGLAFLLAYQRDDDLVRVIDNIGPVTPFYLLMHRDMQRTPRVRAFADFAATEIKAFRALLAG